MEKNSQNNKSISSTTLNFLKDNVLNVTDLTRTNKLSDILNQYVGRESEEVYVIQNSKKRNSQAVIVDFEYFERLLKYKEVVDHAVDDYMYHIAKERKEEKAQLTLDEVFDDGDFDYEKLIKQLKENNR
ncbi:hypothetical protein GCM10011409_25290 [Lentibacillus populi]|uniref:Antitoxin n=1 Tax=Lentibacillus populi TaxID=1827502 RepID=A0A9W5TZC6_9BACI|nr:MULTISPECIES: hypothetical protein [Bacillaceae]GGB46719.1 hypothetical protein GCM10011409_25290 [Lentibacillus populi]